MHDNFANASWFLQATVLYDLPCHTKPASQALLCHNLCVGLGSSGRVENCLHVVTQLGLLIWRSVCAYLK